MALPPVCDILTTICDVEALRCQWMPFVSAFDSKTNVVFYKGEARLDRKFSTYRFKDKRTYYIFENELVERLFLV